MTQPKATVPMNASDSQPVARRKLFVGAGALGAMGAVAAVLPLRQEAPSAPPVVQADPAGGGYQLTEHVLSYYRTARI